MVMYPTRESFAGLIENAFLSRGISLIQWVVSMEEHQTGGQHYHIAVKLSKWSRWTAVKRCILATHGVNVNFTDGEQGETYYMAYQYVVKDDANFVESHDHPEMTARPRTERACRARHSRTRVSGSQRRQHVMSDYELLEIVQKRKLTSRLEVMALAASLQSEGNSRLAEFIARKGHKGVDNAIFLAKELGEAKGKVERA